MGRSDEAALTADTVALAEQYGRYGYRRITALLRSSGWVVKALCDKIEIIASNRYPLPRQTRAVASIRRLIDHHGEDHARLVLCILAEGNGNWHIAPAMS